MLGCGCKKSFGGLTGLGFPIISAPLVSFVAPPPPPPGPGTWDVRTPPFVPSDSIPMNMEPSVENKPLPYTPFFEAPKKSFVEVACSPAWGGVPSDKAIAIAASVGVGVLIGTLIGGKKGALIGGIAGVALNFGACYASYRYAMGE